MAAGVRYVGAKIAQYAGATGQVVYSRIGTSNIVDNAYGVINVAADGMTAVTATRTRPSCEQGNLLKAEGNWWGLRFNSQTNPGPAISPTTNPQMPENPVNGTATVETGHAAATTSNAVDFYPYRSGPQSGPDQRASTRC